MDYQDKKLTAIGRLTIMTAVITMLLLLSLAYPERARQLIQHLPLSRSGSGCEIWISVLAIMAPVCWAMLVTLVVTSPEQEAQLVQWSKRWRKTPTDFESIVFDIHDPNYRKAAWRYFLIDEGSVTEGPLPGTVLPATRDPTRTLSRR